MRRTSRRRIRRRMSTRAHLMPPPVEPAQAPINMSSTRIVLENSGHRLKSVLPKPVVEMMEATWKAAWRTLSPACPPCCKY